MRTALFTAVVWMALAPTAVIAQDWRDWQNANPTYPSGQPTAAPAQSNSRVFLEQTYTVPAGYEWNREIVAKRPGAVTIQVTSNAPKSIIILTKQAFDALQADNLGAIDKEKDMVLVDETTEATYRRTVELPAGRFMIMMENRSTSPQAFHLKCSHD